MLFFFGSVREGGRVCFGGIVGFLVLGIFFWGLRS